MFKASQRLYTNAKDEVVTEPSTTSGTFLLVDEGGTLKDEDAARFGITADNASKYGLTFEDAKTTKTGSGLTIDESAAAPATGTVGTGIKADKTSTAKEKTK